MALVTKLPDIKQINNLKELPIYAQTKKHANKLFPKCSETSSKKVNYSGKSFTY